jgi:hypothetical protein
MNGSGWFGVAVAVVFVLSDRIAFGPEPGTEIERRWTEELELEVDALEQTIGGNPVDLPFDALEFAARRSFVVADELAEVGEGRVTKLARTFSDSALALELTLDGQDLGSAEGAHACDGARVDFAWNDEEGRYERELGEGELDEERLEGLESDLDILGLLPSGELEPGATFEPELDGLRALFRAGGELGFTLSSIQLKRSDVPAELLVAGALGSLHELFAPGGELSGTLEGRYAGREGDDEGLARLEYELDLDIAADLGERFRSFMREATPDSHALSLEVELEGELVVLWDLAAGLARSALFEGDVALTGHVRFLVQLAEGLPQQEFAGHYELSGEARVELVNE